MVDVSVVICTYNGASRIPQVFACLQQQEPVADLAWEIVVVDNNSNDDTAAVCREYQRANTMNVPVRYCFEGRQGLAYARRKGAAVARGDLLAFLDDDNWPHPTWLEAIATFSRSHPQVGAFGGQIHGQFEVPPPPNFDRIARFFALIQGDVPYCYNDKYAGAAIKMFPPGAGLVVRQAAWQSSLQSEPQLPQTGEDLELLLQIWQSGWQLWFVPTIEIDHHIPASRLEPGYLMRFFYRNGVIRYPYRMLQYSSWQRPVWTVLYLVNDLKKLIAFRLRYRRLQSDLIVQCEQQLLIATLFSPVYCLWHQLQQRWGIVWRWLQPALTSATTVPYAKKPRHF